uniref:Heparan-alpha-glucosaminide N-acetyltransferase-like n=1 Tax=Saccoglossus kowalevskii TaxID=10224 RepID=A0ABM0M2Z2_SACKO|nr:PREDICTED: heparan-alpha-glucosaminide N-acetyltransferase-like [Saccoglossus kowalevskii]
MSGIYMMFVNPMGYIDDISPEKIKDEKDASFFCNIIVVEDPVDIYLPIYIAIGVYVGLIILYVFGRYAHKHHWLYKVLFCLETERLVNSDLGSPNSILNASNSESQEQFPKKTEKQKPRRLKSLDTFRGISVVIMIFVNLGGGEYWFFHHSRWNGLTVADLVFPWFVFIMGTSIALAFHSLSIKGFSKKKMFIKICKRSAILFILGLILNTGKDRNGVDLNHIRIPGVLQRFSVCYFVVAIVEMLSVKKDDPYKYKYYAPIRDFVYLWIHWLVAICVVTLYLCLTFVLPIPDCPTGYQGPGGSLLHTDNDTDLYNCTGGAAGHIDKSVFGINHIYPHPTCLVLYQTGPYDPEGILGCLPAIFITFLGLLAGKILIFYTDWKQRVKRWLLWAILTNSSGQHKKRLKLSTPEKCSLLRNSTDY